MKWKFQNKLLLECFTYRLHNNRQFLKQSGKADKWGRRVVCWSSGLTKVNREWKSFPRRALLIKTCSTINVLEATNEALFDLFVFHHCGWVDETSFSLHFFIITIFPVFSLYRSLSADDSNRNENDVDYVYSSVKGGGQEKNELKAAQLKTKQLEQRIAELEKRLPKKYDDVKFLNYQNRKRILVRKKLQQSTFTVKL